ncbi:glyoxalase [Alphaproteobacteria bacterium LSUCC0684]
MDFKEIEADDLGRRLKGMGINILCPAPLVYAPSLARVMGLELIRVDAFFALLSWASPPDITSLIQIHADNTYASNPYHAFLGEGQVRGLGVELRLYAVDPDAAATRAEAEEGWTVLQHATDKEHGIREAFILDPLGYCWVPSLPLQARL